MTKRLYSAYERRVNLSLRLEQAYKQISDIGFELQLEDKELSVAIAIQAIAMQEIVNKYKAKTSLVLENIRKEIEVNVCEPKASADSTLPKT